MILNDETRGLVYLYLPDHLITEEPWKTYLERGAHFWRVQTPLENGRFRNSKQPSILIGTKILQTGINIEEITHFINARGMKSEIATLQALGRALRRHESKEKVYIYDFLDKEKYLKAHSLERKKHYEKEGHTVKVI